jgi:hypothetical protein
MEHKIMRTEVISKNNMVVGAYICTEEEMKRCPAKEREARMTLDNTKNPVLKAIRQFWWGFQYS